MVLHEKNLRPMIALGMALAAIAGAFIKHFLFPPPYVGIEFSNQYVGVTQGQPKVVLSIRRNGPRNERLAVHYHTEDGNAH